MLQGLKMCFIFKSQEESKVTGIFSEIYSYVYEVGNYVADITCFQNQDSLKKKNSRKSFTLECAT